MVGGSTKRPPPSSEQVSRQMKRMPRKDSGPEIRLRQALHALGLRFRVNLKGLPCTPDIAFTRAKIAVFVDGCFWHGCPRCYKEPRKNVEFWRNKVDGNKKRDRRVDRQLRQKGWRVCRIWECRLKKPTPSLTRVMRLLKS